MPAAAAHENANRRALRRCCSRRRNVSYPTPSSPEISLSLAFLLPSLPGRPSAAIGSVRVALKLPSFCKRKRKAGGKHSSASRPGMSVAFGSPPTMMQKIRSSRPKRLKARISSFTHFDWAACGEQMTIWAADPASAALIKTPRSVALGSSSRSLNMGTSRFGTSPWAVEVPIKDFGSRYLSRDLCNQEAQPASRWL